MLPASLLSSPKPVYLLSSDEPLLIRDWLDESRKHLQTIDYEEIYSHQVETGFDWDGLLVDSMSLSLFSRKKCCFIHFKTNKPGLAGAKFISTLSSNPVDDTVYILVMARLDAASKKSAWFKKLVSIGESIELKPVYTNELPSWITERALSKGFAVDYQAAQFLADLTEGNLLATDQELEKLALAFGSDAQISLDQIEQSITRSARYTHYLLVDACLAGQTKRAMKILNSLQSEGFHPVQILYPINFSLEVLLQLKQAQEKGGISPQLWQSLRIWKSKQRLYTSALTRFSLFQIERFLQGCATLDRINKGQQQPNYADDDWHALKWLIDRYSGNR